MLRMSLITQEHVGEMYASQTVEVGTGEDAVAQVRRTRKVRLQDSELWGSMCQILSRVDERICPDTKVSRTY